MATGTVLAEPIAPHFAVAERCHFDHRPGAKMQSMSRFIETVMVPPAQSQIELGVVVDVKSTIGLVRP